MSSYQTPQTFLETLKKLIGSEKFVVYLGGLIALVLTTFGFSEVSEQQIVQLLALIISIAITTGSYLIAKGNQDRGKEAAKIDAAAEKDRFQMQMDFERQMNVYNQQASNRPKYPPEA